MQIGIPKEVKPGEARVGLTPDGVHELVEAGHSVCVEQTAGSGAGFDDDAYRAAGADLAPDAARVFETADLIVKVKEPQPPEVARLRSGQTLFTYLHLAADRKLTEALLASGVVALAYETVTDAAGRLPLLTPMSQVAGRLAVQAGATALQAIHGGAGLLLGGVPGVPRARVVVIGGGTVGANAVTIALGMGAAVTVLDKNLDVLDRLEREHGNGLETRYASKAALADAVLDADLVIGAVLVPGRAAPKLVSADQVRRMRPGSVLVDVAVDQGGCFETTRPTTHAAPTYVIDGVVHYAVANMPGAVPRTSTHALENATLPFVRALADQGWCSACRTDPHLAHGLAVAEGRLLHEGTASDLGLEATP
ncbi:MAG: alanine dehydrogenase, partial [Pseudomonadota bacterium]